MQQSPVETDTVSDRDQTRQIQPRDLEVDREALDTGGPGGDDANGGQYGDNGRPSGDGAGGGIVDRTTVGLWLLLGAITMFFGGFVSVYIVRSREMAVGPMPEILWLSTVALLLSSATVEWARRGLKSEQLQTVRQGLAATVVLGLLFVAAQYGAWRQLTQAGIYLRSNPHSSFLYLLSGAHGVHVLGGLVVVTLATRRAGAANRVTGALTGSVERTALYWHFMDGLWLLLFALLFWY